MKVLLRYKTRIEEVVIEEPRPPLDLILSFTQPTARKELFAFTGRADGLPYYHFLRVLGRA